MDYSKTQLKKKFRCNWNWASLPVLNSLVHCLTVTFIANCWQKRACERNRRSFFKHRQIQNTSGIEKKRWAGVSSLHGEHNFSCSENAWFKFCLRSLCSDIQMYNYSFIWFPRSSEKLFLLSAIECFHRILQIVLLYLVQHSHWRWDKEASAADEHDWRFYLRKNCKIQKKSHKWPEPENFQLICMFKLVQISIHSFLKTIKIHCVYLPLSIFIAFPFAFRHLLQTHSVKGKKFHTENLHFYLIEHLSKWIHIFDRAKIHTHTKNVHSRNSLCHSWPFISIMFTHFFSSTRPTYTKVLVWKFCAMRASPLAILRCVV